MRKTVQLYMAIEAKKVDGKKRRQPLEPTPTKGSWFELSPFTAIEELGPASPNGDMTLVKASNLGHLVVRTAELEKAKREPSQ